MSSIPSLPGSLLHEEAGPQRLDINGIRQSSLRKHERLIGEKRLKVAGDCPGIERKNTRQPMLAGN
jgi:hypothetical protein